jgi:hypothetical protein
VAAASQLHIQRTFRRVASCVLILPTMDRFDSLASTLSNLTVYDLKSMYNQVRGDEEQGNYNCTR